MDIMSLFRGNGGATAAPSQAAPQGNMLPQPGNLPAQQPAMIAQGSPDGQIPGGNGTPQDQTGAPKSLADEFKSLWDAPKEGEGHNPSAPLKFNVDPAKVRQATRAQDFTKVITPELMSKISEGGQEAMSAMLSAMNSMAQEVAAQSAMTNAEVIQAALEASRQNTLRDIPSMVRKQGISTALREDNPLFSNPAAQPMLQALEAQLVNKFPQASPQEITEYARRYLVSFAQETSTTLGPKDPKQVASDARGKEIDWSNVPVV